MVAMMAERMGNLMVDQLVVLKVEMKDDLMVE